MLLYVRALLALVHLTSGKMDSLKSAPMTKCTSLQQPLGGEPNRRKQMYPQRKVRQTLGVGMLMILILALVACGVGGSAQQKQADKVHGIPEDSQWYEGKPLPAGRYVTEEFKPAMSFTLSKGWTRGGPEVRDAWDIRDIDNDAQWLGFLNAEEVYKPDGSGGLKVAPAPKDMVAWVQTNPFLKTEKPKPVSVGGEKGVQIDAIVADAPKEPACPECADLALVYESIGSTWGVEKGEKIRFIIVEDVKGETVTIIEETTPAGFKEFTAKSQKVLDSVKWGSS
jgi:hypothetical protein